MQDRLVLYTGQPALVSAAGHNFRTLEGGPVD